MKKVNAKLYTDLHEFLGQCDVVTINVPLSGSLSSLMHLGAIITYMIWHCHLASY